MLHSNIYPSIAATPACAPVYNWNQAFADRKVEIQGLRPALHQHLRLEQKVLKSIHVALAPLEIAASTPVDKAAAQVFTDKTNLDQIKVFVSALKDRYAYLRNHPLFQHEFAQSSPTKAPGVASKQPVGKLEALPRFIAASSKTCRADTVQGMREYGLDNLFVLYHQVHIDGSTRLNSTLIEQGMVALWMDKCLVSIMAPYNSPLRRMLEPIVGQPFSSQLSQQPSRMEKQFYNPPDSSALGLYPRVENFSYESPRKGHDQSNYQGTDQVEYKASVPRLQRQVKSRAIISRQSSLDECKEDGLYGVAAINTSDYDSDSDSELMFTPKYASAAMDLCNTAGNLRYTRHMLEEVDLALNVQAQQEEPGSADISSSLIDLPTVKNQDNPLGRCLACGFIGCEGGKLCNAPGGMLTLAEVPEALAYVNDLSYDQGDREAMKFVLDQYFQRHPPQMQAPVAAPVVAPVAAAAAAVSEGDSVEDQEYAHVDALFKKQGRLSIKTYQHASEHQSGKCRAITGAGTICKRNHVRQLGGLCSQHHAMLLK